MQPTDNIIPANTKITYKQWCALNTVIKREKKVLRKIKRGYVELALWHMIRLEHFIELKQNNLPYIFANLLNGTDCEIQLKTNIQ